MRNWCGWRASWRGRARTDSGRPGVRIAASLPPLEASYVKEFELSFEETSAQFGEMMDLLGPYVDIYLGETLSTSFEARAFLQAAGLRETTVWLSLTLDDHGSTDMRGGESLAQVIGELDGAMPDALLINCCTPDSVHKCAADFAGEWHSVRRICQWFRGDSGDLGRGRRGDATVDAYGFVAGGLCGCGGALDCGGGSDCGRLLRDWSGAYCAAACVD